MHSTDDKPIEPPELWGTWEDKNRGKPTDAPRMNVPGFEKFSPAERLQWLEEQLRKKYAAESEDEGKQIDGAGPQ